MRWYNLGEYLKKRPNCFETLFLKKINVCSGSNVQISIDWTLFNLFFFYQLVPFSDTHPLINLKQHTSCEVDAILWNLDA